MSKRYNPLEIRTEARIERLKQVIDKRTDTLTVILENVHDPHNLSAVARSCDAVGILEICLLYHGEQEPRRLEKISSASASKWLEVKYFYSVEQCFEYVRNKGMKIYTTAIGREAVDLYSVDFKEPTAIVFGNEHTGVSELAYKLSDGNIIIPQVGMVKSLNISVACAVTLYEAFRQRLMAGFYDSPQLNPELRNSLLIKWAEK